jgi:isopenicillin N synthase-like dioxygenase
MTFSNDLQLHRVVTDDVIRYKTRQSVIFFINPDPNAVIVPFDGSDKYPPVKAYDYIMKRMEEAVNYAIKEEEIQ